MDYNLTRNIFTLPLAAHLMKDDKTNHSLWLALHLFMVLKGNQIFRANIFHVIIQDVF